MARRAPRIGTKSRRKHRTPNKNQPGIPIAQSRKASTIAWPALHVALEITYVEIASEADLEGQIENEAGCFQDLFAQHRELREALLSPVLPYSVKREIVEQVSQVLSLSKVTCNFI